MAKPQDEKSVTDFNAVRLAVASEEDILSWSYGEVLKPETINYRTQKPERDGLFCERIFGPVKDINPHDTKLKGVRSREAAVDKNGELVTKASSRRERMGHRAVGAGSVHAANHDAGIRGAAASSARGAGKRVRLSCLGRVGRSGVFRHEGRHGVSLGAYGWLHHWLWPRCRGRCVDS